MLKLPPLSLYIHIPWCIKKCPYCDFNSYALNDTLPEEMYIQALVQDLRQDLSFVQNRSLNSIFFGGGTPSLFSPASIGKIIESVASYISFAPDIEITLEANPGTLEHKNFKDYQLAGVNRVSLGVQSFQIEKLKALGRIHSVEDTERAIESLFKAGLKSFNLDIMYGLPEQSIEDALFDLKKALSFSPPHLSWYHLTLEPNTIFYQKPPKVPSDDLVWDIQEKGHALLTQNHFVQYEVSAYSIANHTSRHNLNYWNFGDYLGIGAGAHAKITNPLEQTVTRYWKTRYPKSYLSSTNKPNSFLAGSKTIPIQELPLEFMLNGLRLSEGIEIEYFKQRTGLPLASIDPIIKTALSKELLTIQDQKFIPTDLGKRFLNDLVSLFMLEKNELVENI